MKVTEPTVILPGNDIDIGITARPNATGFAAVEIGMGADPIAFTPEIVEGEMKRLGCHQREDGTWKLSWRFRKEYLRDATAAAGQPVFDPDALDRQSGHLCNPQYLMDLDESGKLIKRERGRVKVWIPPDAQIAGLPEHIEGVERSFGIGMDVSAGVAKSDSTIEVMAALGKEQAAEFGSNTIQPPDLGRMAVAIAGYYNDALICCVQKIHGLTVLRTIVDECQYGMVWRATQPGQMSEKRTDTMGWTRGEASSALLFGKWVDAIEHDETILHSLVCWEQHGQYIYHELAHITHQSLADLPRDLRERHGDYVVGIALAYRACLDLPKFKAMHKRDMAPHGSQAWRMEQDKAKRTRKRTW